MFVSKSNSFWGHFELFSQTDSLDLPGPFRGLCEDFASLCSMPNRINVKAFKEPCRTGFGGLS